MDIWISQACSAPTPARILGEVKPLAMLGSYAIEKRLWTNGSGPWQVASSFVVLLMITYVCPHTKLLLFHVTLHTLYHNKRNTMVVLSG